MKGEVGKLSGEVPLQGLDSAGGKIPAKSVATMSRNELLREVDRLNRVVDKADLAATVERALGQRAALRNVPKLLHKEAFMLMTYRSEGGTEELRIWNSRDGVTPFVCYVNGMKFQHVVGSDLGPYMDRPECDAQWETRTVRGMMEAWQRSLNRAAIAGKIDKPTLDRLKDDAETAKANNLYLGLRDLTTGRFTDDF